jgi:hypothetical protein
MKFVRGTLQSSGDGTWVVDFLGKPVALFVM